MVVVHYYLKKKEGNEGKIRDNDWKTECKSQMNKVIEKCTPKKEGGKNGGHIHEKDGKMVFGFGVYWEKEKLPDQVNDKETGKPS